MSGVCVFSRGIEPGGIERGFNSNTQGPANGNIGQRTPCLQNNQQGELVWKVTANLRMRLMAGTLTGP